MRRRLALAGITATALATGVAGVAIASGTSSVTVCLRSAVSLRGGCGFPSLTVKVGGRVVRKGLSAREVAPAALKLWGKVSTSDSTHPSALREMTIDLDRNIAVDVKGLPICHPFARHQSAGDLRKSCKAATVGSGTAHFEYAFPEERPVSVGGNLIAYNGGVKGGVVTLYVVAFVSAPLPGTVVMPIEIAKIHEGRYGLRAVAKLPRIVGGSGSLLDFKLGIERLFNYRGAQKSLATAKCPGGRLAAGLSAHFRNEAETPGVPATTAIRGTVALPCS
jgi:hypothetical protein